MDRLEDSKPRKRPVSEPDESQARAGLPVCDTQPSGSLTGRSDSNPSSRSIGEGRWWKDGERWIAANGALTSTVPTRVTLVITVKR